MKIKMHYQTAYFVFSKEVKDFWLLRWLGFERCSYNGHFNAYAFVFGF